MNPDPLASAALPASPDSGPNGAVPPALRPRRDGWTADRQRLFLAELALTGNVAASAAAAEMSARSAFRLRVHPAGVHFARAWDAALMTAAGGLLSVAFQRAVDGTPRQLRRDGRVVAETRVPSDRMLMFLLRHLNPDLFGYAGPAPRRAAAVTALRDDYRQAVDALADCDEGAGGPGDEDADPAYPVTFA